MTLRVKRFDVANVSWMLLPGYGPAPVYRFDGGIAATPDGMLYIFGGDIGEERQRESSRRCER